MLGCEYVAAVAVAIAVSIPIAVAIPIAISVAITVSIPISVAVSIAICTGTRAGRINPHHGTTALASVNGDVGVAAYVVGDVGWG